MVGADWSERGNYVTTKHGINPAAADEALSDPERLVIDPDPASRSGRSTRVIGYSPTEQQVITVIVLDHHGRLYGVNAWRSNSTDRRRYQREGDQL